MALSKLPSSRRPHIFDRPEPTSPIPTLSSIATQIRAIADLFQQNCATIEQMGQQIQFLETRMKTLESASVQATESTSPPIPEPPRRKPPLLPQIASRWIKIYFMALVGLGLFMWLSFLLNMRMEDNLIEGIVDVFRRVGIMMLLFFGVVAVQQSVR
jgi:uncharacterized coiled-coil protein SlyX